ncbi:hypothetical protein ACFFRR_002170 [Megaselia abdita]
MTRFTLLTLVILYIFHQVRSFEENSIFEDEDIYNKALPPLPEGHNGLTYPGTKWCGPGDIAVNYEDLGTEVETDKCCRDHDHCEEILEGHKTLHGLSNSGVFPILKCTCEQRFLNCLQKANTTTSIRIGRAYFWARNLCIKDEYPIEECALYQKGTIQQRCVRYKLDSRKKKTWQFFDIPFFT